MTKVLINKSYGGFQLSDGVVNRYKSLTGKTISRYGDVDRTDPILIQVVEEIGLEMSSPFWTCDLKIVEVPDDIDWEIGDYDGKEWVAEKHRRWD